MYVKPADGLKVRDPFMKDHLPPEGREVSDLDLYWQRLLLDGDVVEAPPPANAVRDGASPPAAPAAPAAVAATSKPAEKAPASDGSSEV